MKPITIFISSVQREFANERRQLCDYIRQDALLGRFFTPFLFEELPAVNLSAPDAYISEVERIDIYLGILGNSYGYEDSEGVSPTEREYDKATAESKYRIAFICNAKPYEREEKEKKFISKVEGDVVRKSFGSFEELRSGVYAALVYYLEKKEYLRLLPFDAATSRVTVDDIDKDKIRRFIRTARNKRNFPMTEDADVKDVLTHLALLSEDGRLANAAILLFGKHPQRHFVTSEVKCAQFYGTEISKPIQSYQVYRGDVFELVEQAVGFVMSRINARVGTRDKQVQVDVDYELPQLAVTEAIVNAIAHRDYTNSGSVQIMLYRDRLEVLNPGSLPIGLTVEKLTQPHQSQPTNPLLANSMYLAGSIERLGTGTGDIISRCEDAGLKTPEFTQSDIFKVVLWRNYIPVISTSPITVLGVGGAGGNIVKHMKEMGVYDVDFVVCNTDGRSLENIDINHKIQLGDDGTGVGNNTELGRAAAQESINQVRDKLEALNTKMLIIVAGMGGGTGTVASAVIAKMARDMGVLTIALVTTPLHFEGSARFKQAESALPELEMSADSLFVVNNDDLLRSSGNLSLGDTFAYIDNTLCLAVKSIVEIITVQESLINLDMADVSKVLKNSGRAVISRASGRGEKRAELAIKAAIESPLLGGNNITAAKNILINICTKDRGEVHVAEVSLILEAFKGQVHSSELIWGMSERSTLEDDELEVVIIASGFSCDVEA